MDLEKDDVLFLIKVTPTVIGQVFDVHLLFYRRSMVCGQQVAQ